MAGDISRSTFLQPKHYSGVRMQQGRVQMDADWNEQLDIRTYIDQTTNLDVIGAAGVPESDPGFGITVQAGNLLISKGRAYVDGILCENDQDALIALPSPAGATPDQPDLPGVNFTTAGGIAFSTLLTNLGGGPGFTLPPTPGIYAAYLDVWERDITALDDPSIREIALGGPDTCTRTKTVWQVKLLRLGDLTSTQTCAVPWSSFLPPSTGKMEAQAQPDPGNNNPCSIPAQAGYRSLENQLYRVEIHQSGAAGTATLKWSREDASVLASWVSVDPANPNNLIVSTLGKDQTLGFAGGQWVELTDDTRELWGIPGTLVQLSNAQVTALGPTLTINVPPGSVNFADYPVNPKIRRWDEVDGGGITLSNGAVPLTENTWINLENGVQVFFVTGGHYNTGDFWLIPARTATAITAPIVEWPTDDSTPPNPLPQPPAGIIHHYCSLALLQFSTTGWTVTSDCRVQFPPLTGITTTGADKGIHVTGVNFGSAPLLNDSYVPIVNFEREAVIRVLLDAPVDPNSIQQATCFLTVDVPYPLDLFQQTPLAFVFGSQTVIVTGAVSVLNSTTAGTGEVDWRSTNRTLPIYLTVLLLYMLENNLGYRFLARLTLKGDVIWGLNDATLFLDGDTFGFSRQEADGPHTSLQFPSGDGKRGGDFSTWFWLAYAAGAVGVIFQQSSVVAVPSATASAYVILTRPAPTAGATITLTSQAVDQNNKAIAVPIGTIPASVTIGAGLTSTTFAVQQLALPQGVTSATLTVTASFAGATGQGSVQITAPPAGTTTGGSVVNPVTIFGGFRPGTLPIKAPQTGGLL